MPAPTVAVSVRLYGSDGAAQSGVLVTARLDKADEYEGFIVSDPVTGTTDADGLVVLDLFPNHPTTGLGTTGSVYTISATPSGAKRWSVQAQIPNEDCDLDDHIMVEAEPADTFTQTLAGTGGAALVGFTQTGSGAQLRDLQEREEETPSIFDYMTAAQIADVQANTGLLDVTTAVQAAIAANYGRTLRAPAGTYILSSETVLTAGITIVGTRGKTIFKASSLKPLTTDLFSTTTSDAPTRTVKNLVLYGIVFDGASLAPQRWLQDADGNTIADPEADYYDAATNPSGKIGNPAFPDWTIADTVAAGRRNANYTEVASLLELNLVENGSVRHCEFRNHYGRAIFERGGLHVTIEDNVFDTVGKNDGAYHCIYTQSYGTPGAGQAFYCASEDIQIRNNRARNLERSFCAFMPAKGGILENNHVDGWQESCVYVSDAINYDGGFSIIRGNTFKNGTVSDIVGYGVEAGSSRNLLIEKNFIEAAQGGAITTAGSTNVTVRENTIKECGSDFTYPYGPFSERYAYNVGTTPVAGDAVAVAAIPYFTIGSQSSNGGSNVVYQDNTVIEERASPPTYLFQQTKSGSSSIAGSTVIEGGNLPSGMTLLDTTTGTVWETNIPLSIRNVIGHASEAPVVFSRVFVGGVTGLVNVSVGFRPRSVLAYASTNVAGTLRSSFGAFSWNKDASRNDFAVSVTSETGVGQNSAVRATDVARLLDAAGTTVFLLEFAAWTETGITLNTITSTEDVYLRLVCNP